MAETTIDAQFLMPDLRRFGGFGPDGDREGWAGLFAGSFLGLLIGGPWSILLGFGGLLVGAFLGREAKRQREIDRIMKKADETLLDALQHLIHQFDEKIQLFCDAIEQRHVHDRISIFVKDAERQLSLLGKPIGQAEQDRLAKIEDKGRTAVVDLQALAREMALDLGEQSD